MIPEGRSGRGATVAIVDSGVEGSHPWLAAASITHLCVERLAVIEGEPVDHSGHGTACAGIVHRLAPAARIVSVSVLDAQGRTTRDALLAALRFCVAQRFDVVNLSLGIDFPREAPLRPSDHRSIVDLYETADAAYTAGVVLVAAGPNVEALRTYPGRFKSLIGVGRARFADGEMLRSEITADHEIVAPGEEVLAPALGGGERRWTGTSFAVPHVSAHVARLRAARPGLPVESIKAALHRMGSSLPPAPAAW